ncbi:MAG: hypothetical protein KDD61_18225, partial [Bdellovibrionales bacterium]|nr:hypothetical protein [Bdellovibrionales bacterium]
MNIYRLFLGLLFCFLTLSSWATSLGPQKTAVFLLDHQHFLNDPTSRPKKDQIYEALFQSPYSLAAFYKESSYDRLQITGNVFGWFQVDATQCLLNEKELVKLTKNAIDWTDWDRIIVLSYLDPTLCPDVGLGHSTFGKIQVSTPNGTAHVSLSFALLNNRFVLPQLPFQTLSGITSSVVAHEYGHALGIYGHANLYDCGRHTVSPDWKECHQEAIADRFSIMGGEGVYRVGLHHNACHKEQLGWFQNSQLLDVAPKAHPQVFRIYPYSSQDKDRIVAIKIALYQPIPIVTEKNVKLSVLHLTNRTAEGFDRRIEDLKKKKKY